MLEKPRKKKPARKFRQTLLQGVLLLSLILALSWPAAAGPVPRLEDMEAVQHATVTPDDQLDRLRGRAYDTLYFGYEVVADFNADSGELTGQVNFQTNVPLEEVNVGPTQVSFNNGQVSYQAGIGNTAFGPGIYNIAQVVGEKIIFISNMDVTLNIQGLTPASLTGLATRPAVSAMTR